jgi:hypothetical protein
MKGHRIPKRRPLPVLTEEDYYTNEQGFVVFTAAYHQKRGYCCKNGCLHCPYGFRKKES